MLFLTPIGHAHVIYGSTYPSAHTFEVVTTCYSREAPGDAGGKHKLIYKMELSQLKYLLT